LAATDLAHAITFTGGEAKQQHGTKKGVSPVHKRVQEFGMGRFSSNFYYIFICNASFF
jgi:hypothetical protein